MSQRDDTEKGGAPGSADRSTQLAQERTDLAMERNFMALERTMMAWVRTSLSMISFGFTIAKFFEYLNKEHNLIIRGPLGREWSPGLVGITLVGLGIFVLIVAALQYRQNVQLMQKEGLRKRWSLALTVAVILGLLGIFAFLGLIMNQ